jgi:LmbE family N-acetylglucosaminyl deacetylase
MTKPVAMAIAAHPDDIEFMMAGTLLQLGQAGYELHLMNLANGCLGSAKEDRATTIARRQEEAQEAAKSLGAHWHAPIANDLELFYTYELIEKVTAAIREAQPDILLVPSPEDYMEDHMNACRLSVSGAFCRGMPNFVTNPPRDAINKEVTLYHALPYGLQDGLRRVIKPEQYVDITSVMVQKRAALACHRSQKEWLDVSQGLDSYLHTMEDMSRTVGEWSGVFQFAEGWRRHSHLGFCAPDADPLKDALGELHHTSLPLGAVE